MKLPTLLTAVALLGTCVEGLAQLSATARAASEVAEALVRRGTAEASGKAAAELAGIGGTMAIQEILESAQKEGGEALMRSVARQSSRHGVLALTALRGAPAAVIRAIDNLPAELAENGLRAVAREPQVMSRMVSEFGEAALETAARHPGLAGPIANRLGSEGLDVARRLSTEEAIRLSRHADELARLAPAERSAFLNMMRSAPSKTLAWIEKHPRLLIAGSATTAVIAARREIFGDGTSPGFLERAGAALYQTFRKPLNLAAAGLTAAVLAWAGLHLWGVWRRLRRRPQGR
jgi:hypothetical protein